MFELVPPVFAECAGQAYAQIGYPQLNPANIWEVYRKLIRGLYPPPVIPAGIRRNKIWQAVLPNMPFRGQ